MPAEGAGAAGVWYAWDATTLYRSADDGATWTTLPAGPWVPPPANRSPIMSVAIPDGQPDVVYLTAGSYNPIGPVEGSFFWVSRDGGNTWSPEVSGFTAGRNLGAIAIDGAGRIYVSTGGQLWSTTDGGSPLSWVPHGSLTAGDVIADPHDPDGFWLVGSSFALGGTLQRGQWTVGALSLSPEVNPLPLVLEGRELLVADPFVTGGLVASSTHGAIYRSADGGASWTQLPQQTPYPLHRARVVPDPLTPGAWYAFPWFTDKASWLLKTTTGGDWWWSVRSGLPFAPVISELVVDPDTAQRVIALTSTGLFELPPPAAPSGVPPLADFSVIAAPEGSSTAFTDASTDDDGDIVTWTWDFGDLGGSTDPSPSHVYLEDGSYEVTLTVTDSLGASDATMTTIVIANLAPLVDPIVAPAGPVALVDLVEASATFVDPGILDTHTASWDWGDTSGSAAAIVDAGGAGTASGDHTYAAPGIYTLRLVVTDDDGDSTEVMHESVVVAAPPIADFSVTPAPEGSSTAFTDLSAADPAASIVSWDWDFGDPGGSTDQSPSHVYVEDGSFEVTLTVTDSLGASDSTMMTVVVANLAPVVDPIVAPLGPLLLSALVEASATFSDPGVLDTHTGSWDWGDGAITPAAVAEAGGAGTATGDHTYSTPGTYTLRLVVTDDDGDPTEVMHESVVVAAPPSADFSVTPAPEGSSTAFTNISGADPAATIVTWAWTFGDGDGSTDTSPSHTYLEDGSYEVTLIVTDSLGASDSTTITVDIANLAPLVDPIAAPADPVAVGALVEASATFADPGVLDTHSASWDWGDGAVTLAAVAEADGAGTASGDHTYAAPGIYTLRLTVTDDEGDSTEVIFEFVVVYDPTGGFVTGGGWFESPPGAYTPEDPDDPDVIGKASFGFVSKYRPGASVPTGNTQFQFRAADLKFHSDSYQWLVIAGARAQFKGEGSLNGVSAYGFLLTAVDSDVVGGGEFDRFRIKIWEIATGTVVYDNQAGDGDDAALATGLGGGSITIHR